VAFAVCWSADDPFRRNESPFPRFFLLCAVAIDAIAGLARQFEVQEPPEATGSRASRRRDIQEAVDVAVGVVDVSPKANATAQLDGVPERIDPDSLPPEVVLAVLVTSKPGAPKLQARQALVVRFEAALKGRRRPDAESLMRFAR
jgi:hypothetical protein